MTAALPFLGVIQGIGWGRFNFKLHHKKLYLNNLPKEFNGLAHVQLSDAHLVWVCWKTGGLYEVNGDDPGAEPDLVVFTGVMVNNFASEMNGWTRVFADMPAKLGNSLYSETTTLAIIPNGRARCQDSNLQRS
jgi:predicted MPP superfamily phosphohydrolase